MITKEITWAVPVLPESQPQQLAVQQPMMQQPSMPQRKPVPSQSQASQYIAAYTTPPPQSTIGYFPPATGAIQQQQYLQQQQFNLQYQQTPYQTEDQAQMQRCVQYPLTPSSQNSTPSSNSVTGSTYASIPAAPNPQYYQKAQQVHNSQGLAPNGYHSPPPSQLQSPHTPPHPSPNVQVGFPSQQQAYRTQQDAGVIQPQQQPYQQQQQALLLQQPTYHPQHQPQNVTPPTYQQQQRQQPNTFTHPTHQPHQQQQQQHHQAYQAPPQQFPHAPHTQTLSSMSTAMMGKMSSRLTSFHKSASSSLSARSACAPTSPSAYTSTCAANPTDWKKWGKRAALGIGAVGALALGMDAMDGGLFDGGAGGDGGMAGVMDGQGAVDASAAQIAMEQSGQSNAVMLLDPVGTEYVSVNDTSAAGLI